MFNPTLKMRETLLFFLIVVINGLIRIDSAIVLDMCARKRWREEYPYDICCRLLYPGGDKSEKVYISYKVQPTKGLNLLKESECHTSVQIVLCIFYLQINNIQKYYQFFLCFFHYYCVCTNINKQLQSQFYIFKHP